MNQWLGGSKLSSLAVLCRLSAAALALGAACGGSDGFNSGSDGHIGAQNDLGSENWANGHADAADQVENVDLELLDLSVPISDQRPPDAGSIDDATPCVSQCATAGETQCSQGRVRRCESDSHGCLQWSAEQDCPVAFCADATSCRSTVPLGCSQTAPATCGQLELEVPRDYQVVQRDTGNGADVTIRGKLPSEATAIRLVARFADGREVASALRTGVATSTGATFQVSLRLPAGGWYQLWVQATPADGRRVVAETVVKHVGVGEVFLTAGQSNSVASGEAAQVDCELCSGATLNGEAASWTATIDVQGSPAGSPWPVMAAMLGSDIGVPVAVMSVGCGGTSSKQWLPADSGSSSIVDWCGADAAQLGGLYQRLVRGLRALGNVRAVLWHQGETDAGGMVSTTEYIQDMQQIIARLATDSGRSYPWVVANASYIPGNEINTDTCAARQLPLQHYDKMAPIRAAQQWLWTHGMAHRGPDTDGLIYSAYRYPGPRGACIHFNDAGLKAHGALWYQAIGDTRIVPGTAGPPNTPTHVLYRYRSANDHYLLPVATDLSAYGYVLEGPGMRVYSTPPAHPYTLYPCLMGGVSHFLSTRVDCETHTREGEVVGYLAQNALVGTTPIYRFISPAPRTDLLSVPSLDEGYAAGYILQGPQGFAPR